MALLFPPAPCTPLWNLLSVFTCPFSLWCFDGLPHQVQIAEDGRAETLLLNISVTLSKLLLSLNFNICKMGTVTLPPTLKCSEYRVR